jgi:thioredoxin reductase (NADPH)
MKNATLTKVTWTLRNSHRIDGRFGVQFSMLQRSFKRVLQASFVCSAVGGLQVPFVHALSTSSMSAETKKVKLVIVGSGPAGLTAAIYAGRAGLKPVMAAGSVRGQILPGGQLMITTEVENYPGFPEPIEGPELMERFLKQAKNFGTEYYEEWATEFQFKQGGPHKLKIGKQDYEADAIILANGAAAKWLNNPEEDKYRNNGISACATCDGPLPRFKKKKIYVVGGGDTACEEAMFLARFASKVYLVHRRDQLRASKIMQQRVLNHEKIEMVWNTQIVGYKGEKTLDGLVLKDTVTGETREVDCAGLFMAIGHEPNTKELVGTGVELDAEGYIKVQNHVHTNIDGVFAAGDNHDTYFRQAVTAAGFGCMSAITAERWLEARELDSHAGEAKSK